MWILTLFLCCGAPVHADAWDDVLKQAGLTKEQTRFDPLDLQMGLVANLRSPFFNSLHGDPLRIPFFARLYREAVLSYATKPFDLTVSSLQRVGIAVRRNMEGDPLATAEAKSKGKNALSEAIAHLHQLGGKPLTVAQRQDLNAKVKSLSPEAGPTIAYILEAEADAYEWRQRALASLDQSFLKKAWSERLTPPRTGPETPDGATSPVLRRLVKDVDLKLLMVGGIDLIYGVSKVREKIKLAPSDHLEWNTPLGQIVIRGDDADNIYPGDKAYLLIIDAGGNDTYYGGGASYDLAHPVSVLIDLKGNDRYLAQAALGKAEIGVQPERKNANLHPSFGAGVFGYGLLIDVEGDDLYRSYRMTQGRGDFGIGWLWDLGGNDVYDCWTQGQGSAEFGAGLLLDGSGRDHYSAFQEAQGFAGPQGAGILLDAAKDDDVYIGNNALIDFPSVVDAKFNTNFVQGASLGIRGDGSDGYSLAGGYGALVDGGGNNHFNAGFFAQGIAYWYGVGWLSVGDGNDVYEAGKYALGAATHFGVGVFHDTGGNDSYSVRQELALGEGHDFGVGFFIEDSGDDTYNAPGLSLGCASAQGMGFFWDRAGNDTYVTKEKEVLGCASMRIDTPSFRVGSRTLGVFLDTGGTNHFKTPIKGLDGGDTTSSNWRTPGAGYSQKLEGKITARLLGVGRVTNHPETEDPL